MKILKEYDEYEEQGRECEEGMGYVILCTSKETGNYIIVRGSRDPMGKGRRMLFSIAGVEEPSDDPIDEDYCEKHDGSGILLESQDFYFPESRLKGWYEEHYGEYNQGEVLKWLSSLHSSNILTGPYSWNPNWTAPNWPPSKTQQVVT